MPIDYHLGQTSMSKSSGFGPGSIVQGIWEGAITIMSSALRGYKTNKLLEDGLNENCNASIC